MNRSGTLVLGLDQEPPTLDPHASRSAVTYPIIASVTRPTASSHPWLAESWTTSKDCVRYERAFDRCGGGDEPLTAGLITWPNAPPPSAPLSDSSRSSARLPSTSAVLMA
jgi:hypothetical protein